MVLSSPKRKENSRLMNLSGNMNVAFPFNCDRHKSETERKLCSQCKISRKIIDRGKYYYQRTRENRGLLSLGMNEGWRLNWAGLTKWQGNRWSDLGLTKMHFSVFLMPSRQIRVFRMCSLSRKRGIVPKQKFQSRGWRTDIQTLPRFSSSSSA